MNLTGQGWKFGVKNETFDVYKNSMPLNNSTVLWQCEKIFSLEWFFFGEFCAELDDCDIKRQSKRLSDCKIRHAGIKSYSLWVS